MNLWTPTTTRRDALLGTSTVHGGGRRPGRPVVVDVAELEAWTAANRRAIEANRDRRKRERWLEAHAI